MAGVICGHIHRPALRAIGSTLYGNAGDWVDNCTALVEREDGVLALLSFADSARRAELASARLAPSG
jgi:UDP-2,3-diacylglucosamine pyrophosphatase LpxH